MATVYIEGKGGESFADALHSLRPGDGLVVKTIADLARNRAQLRERMEAIHAKGCYIKEVTGKRDSRKPDDRAAMIFDAADVLGKTRKGHDPAKAREYGSRGGRPRADRGIPDDEAEKHWFSLRHATNADAIKHMGKWTEHAAWRKWGASGRKTGPRRPLPTKRKRKS